MIARHSVTKDPSSYTCTSTSLILKQTDAVQSNHYLVSVTPAPGSTKVHPLGEIGTNNPDDENRQTEIGPRNNTRHATEAVRLEYRGPSTGMSPATALHT